MYAIKRQLLKLNIPIKIWSKLLDSVIQLGSEVWGPLSQQNYSAWDKHPTETLHSEFCRNILQIQGKTPNNVCRAELGRFRLVINIKIIHLKSSPIDTLQFKALQSQELNPEKSPLSQLVLKLTPVTQSNLHHARKFDEIAIRP